MIAVQIESTNNNFSVSVLIKDYCQYTSYIVLRSLFSCHHVHKQTNISFIRCENERILKITNNTNFDDWERQRDLDVAACKYVFFSFLSTYGQNIDLFGFWRVSARKLMILSFNIRSRSRNRLHKEIFPCSNSLLYFWYASASFPVGFSYFFNFTPHDWQLLISEFHHVFFNVKVISYECWLI